MASLVTQCIFKIVNVSQQSSLLQGYQFAIYILFNPVYNLVPRPSVHLFVKKGKRKRGTFLKTTLGTRFAIRSFNFQWLPNFSAFLLLCFYASSASLDNIFGCDQLNWPWHFKQCSIAPELSHFPFMLFCWCSVVLVITFSFVSPMHSVLQLQFNA